MNFLVRFEQRLAFKKCRGSSQWEFLPLVPGLAGGVHLLFPPLVGALDGPVPSVYALHPRYWSPFGKLTFYNCCELKKNTDPVVLSTPTQGSLCTSSQHCPHQSLFQHLDWKGPQFSEDNSSWHLSYFESQDGLWVTCFPGSWCHYLRLHRVRLPLEVTLRGTCGFFKCELMSEWTLSTVGNRTALPACLCVRERQACV